MAGLSSPTSATSSEAFADFAESYLEMHPASELTRTHRSSRWEWPASSGSHSWGSRYSGPWEYSWGSPASSGLHSYGSRYSGPWEYSWGSAASSGSHSWGSRYSGPWEYSWGSDRSEVVEEESLQARALKFNNPDFVRDFFEGKQRESIAVRRGIANPPTLRAISLIQPPTPSPVQSSTLSSNAQSSAALSWSYFSPRDTDSCSLQSSSQSRVSESPSLCKSPEHASFGDGRYTQKLLMRVTQQLTRVLEALADQQDEIEKLRAEPIVSSRYFRQQLLAFNKRLIALEKGKAAREEVSRKSELKRQQSVRFGAEASSKSAQEAQQQHRVYPKEKWPSTRDTTVSDDETNRARKRVTFQRQGVQSMAHAATERFEYPKEIHPRVLQSPNYAFSNKIKSVAHPLSRAAQSENADDSRLKARPTVAAKLVTVFGKAAITVMAAVCFHGMVKKLC